MGLLDDLSQHLGGDAMANLAGTIGADPKTTQSAVAMALPMLLGGLARNTARPEGAQALGEALQRDHDGTMLGDVSAFLGGDQSAAGGKTADGAGILGHVLGQRQSAVADGIGKATGMDSDQTRRLLTLLAPVVLGYLGNRMRKQNLEPQQIGAELQQEGDRLAASAPGGLGGLLGSLLDRDKDGSMTDDITRIAGGFLGGRKS